MKVFRIDTNWGLQETLTEKELHESYTKEEIADFENDNNTYFYETNYTIKQLNRARKLHHDEVYTYKFEQEYGISPSVQDILQHLYG
jgi:hypothetical protein